MRSAYLCHPSRPSYLDVHAIFVTICASMHLDSRVAITRLRCYLSPTQSSASDNQHSLIVWLQLEAS